MKRHLLICTNAWPILTLMVFFLLVPTESSALRIELDFDRLPSQQGWDYHGTTPEAAIFSVFDNMLFMQGSGLDKWGSSYFYRFAIDPERKLSIETRLRITNADNHASRHVFSIDVWGNNCWHQELLWVTLPGAENFGVITFRYANPTHAYGEIYPVNNSEFHDYRLEIVPGGEFKAFFDGLLFADGRTPFGYGNDEIHFHFGNPLITVAMSRFVFDQRPADQAVPEPATIVLFLSGISGIAVRKCYLSRIRKNEAH